MNRRIDAIDVVRGVAILGTLWTNIWLFTDPWGLLGGLSAAGQGGEAWIQALSQGKFLALLTLTFGVGLAIQHDSAMRRGVRWPGRYLWRAFLLLLDGLVNYILIAEFDVLMGYAVTGAIVAWLLLTRPRTQRVVIAVTGALHLLVITALALLLSTLPPSEPPTGVSPYASESFLGLAAFRLENVVTFRAEPVLIGCLSVAMFLLGARLHRAGVFAESGARIRRRLMLLGGIALPIDLGLGGLGGEAGVLLQRYATAPLVALGLLALLAELCLRRGTDGWAPRRLREVGRVALSAYLLQNLLAGAVFYGWGLGLAEHLGELRTPATLAAWAAISAVIVLAAHLWLRRFRLGPVEWLWKRGEQLLPERRRADAPVP